MSGRAWRETGILARSTMTMLHYTKAGLNTQAFQFRIQRVNYMQQVPISTEDLAQNSTSFHLSLIEDKGFNISLKFRQ